MMALANENWIPCSVHEMHLAFLRSEWDKWPLISAHWDRGIISGSADVSSLIENNLRAQMIWTVRSGIFQWIPADTQWFRLQHARRQHVPQLRAINHADWTSSQDMNELEKVARRVTHECWIPEGAWSPILWAHDKDGPFTIIEGNHRMTALARSDMEFSLDAFVGLSKRLCVWHRLDGLA
jgi:hypothetical protein